MTAHPSNLTLQPIDELARLVLERWATHDTDVVVASGSRVEDLGNPTSDVDLLFVFTDEPERAKGMPPIEVRHGHTFNYGPYSLDAVLALADRVNQLTPDDHDAIRWLPLNILDRYYRFANAYPVFNERGLRRFQPRFHKPHAEALVATWAGLRAMAHLEAARGFRRSGQGRRAIQSSRRAFESALDSTLAARGEGYPSFKWRFEKLARLVGAESAEFREAWLVKAPGQRGAQAYFHEVEAYCEHVGVSRFPALLAPPSVSPDAEIFQLGPTTYLCYRKAHLFELDADAAQVWASLSEGRSIEAAVEALASASGRAQGEAQTAVANVIDELVVRGLLSIEQ